MLWPGRFSSTGDPGPEFSATAVSGQRTESGDGGNRAVEHRLSGAGDNGVAKYRQAERRIPASVPCSAWMGAHQPDRRLRLASEPEERRGAISAATNAGKTSLFSPIQATCPKAPCAPSSGKPASRSTPSSVPICWRQRKDKQGIASTISSHSLSRRMCNLSNCHTDRLHTPKRWTYKYQTAWPCIFYRLELHDTLSTPYLKMAVRTSSRKSDCGLISDRSSLLLNLEEILSSHFFHSTSVD